MKIIFLLLLSLNIFASSYLDDNLTKLNWNGVEVVWLQDSSLPTYDVSIYFAEGALGDHKIRSGETELMFDQLTSGTNRYKESEIVENLEFFGASYGANVTHESSYFTVAGLVKDMVPTMKMVCHLFSDSTFPAREFKRTQKQIISGKKSIITNHSALAGQIFRNISLKGSGYERPVSGTIGSIKKIRAKHLAKRLNHFNHKVKKRIYVKGPSSIKELENIFMNDCAWGKAEYVRERPIVKAARKGKIVFVPMKGANQAQVKLGRIMTTQEVRDDQEIARMLTSKYMGGGITSRLFQKLRTEKGLTYSVSAYVSQLGSYGRSGISTFTKNETIVELLKNIEEVISANSNAVLENNFVLSKGHLKGAYLFSLESTSALMGALMSLDHENKPYSVIENFPKEISAVTSEQVKLLVNKIFNWKEQIIVILGDKSLVKKLKKSGYKLEVVSYKKFL